MGIKTTYVESVPEGADAVLMVEFTEKDESGEEIVYYKTCAPQENIIKIGSDVKKDELLFKKGMSLYALTADILFL